MSIQPCHKRVLLRITKTDSNIVRPDQDTILGSDVIEVVAIAPDVTCCKVGDRVMLIPDPRNFIMVERKEAEATLLFNESVIAAVILEDKVVLHD